MRALVAAAVAVGWIVPSSAAPPAGAAACSGCHAASTRVATPVARLAGRDPADIVKAMREFREGARPATVMDRIAKGFTDEEVQAIAAWYAGKR
ncbi:MAG: cytochrome C [Betaproteobacteria bacterium]|nr:cytochrome C [Betaproteobacteria bacterium]